MARWGLLLQCVAESVASQGLRGLMGMVPFGQVLCEVGQGVVERYSKKVQRAEEVACLQEMVVQSHAAIRAEVESRYESIVQNVPESVRAEIQKPEVRARVVAYAAQVPASFRASLRRPEDPTGSTVPKTLTISQPNDVFRFLPQRPPRFQTGDRPVGNWKLTDCLGIGGFGEVWKAEHHAVPGLVMALKFCLSPESKSSLVRESQLLGRIMSLGQREGIVALRNAHLDIETPCLEYDYINGGDLSGIFATWPSWNTEQKHKHALQFLKKLAQIVAPLHAMTPPIVHRDLKPANVLLSRINGKLEVQITDFGIGAIMAESALAEHRSGMTGKGVQFSQSGKGSYTPLYASPEQVLGAHPDPRDDVHALGVIGYQLLIGNLMKAPSVDFADDLEDEHVAPPIIDLIKKCVATRRERRLPNAGALMVELNKALEASGIRSGQASPTKPETTKPTEPTPAPKPVVAPVTTAKKESSIGETIQIPLTASMKLTCAWVPPGQSWLGGGGGTEGETPFAFEKGLWCGIYQVTQEQWQAVMGDNPSHFKTNLFENTAKNPVENISYNDAQEFLQKVNATNSRTGFLYRLPTADEWEYILRGGPILKSQSQYHYYFARGKADLTAVGSNDLSSTQANFDGNYPAGSGKKGPCLESTSAVGNYLPNPLGMYDMHGNVWEWTSTEKGSDRVVCGGGWHGDGPICEASYRFRRDPDYRDNFLGFRLVVVPPPNEQATKPTEPTPAPKPIVAPVTPAKPAPRIGETIQIPLTASMKLTCAWVPPGQSWLGGGGGTEGETPFAFEKGLWCGIYPVTQEQWQAVMGNNPSHFKNKAKNPVENVSYDDVQKFLQKLNSTNSRSGFLYRLPTADEWEYIFRGGPISKSQSQYHYYFARSKTDLTAVHTNDLSSTQANFDGNYPAGSGKKGPYLESTSAVGNYLPNPLGMYDLHGNVWEWTSTKEGSDRVLCGGGWHDYGLICVASIRFMYDPDSRLDYLGFRLLAVPVGG